jgi:hypothetical protein
LLAIYEKHDQLMSAVRQFGSSAERKRRDEGVSTAQRSLFE